MSTPKKRSLKTRAQELFDQISKRGNLHGHSFTMMADSDEETVNKIERELELLLTE